MDTAFKRVINCTGVVLHTNLGRAPLGSYTLNRAREIIDGYCNIELNIASGKRGHRDDLITPLIKQTTGADGVVTVNNNAAAVMLVLRALAFGESAAVSRGQLIEIGGSFRIPDVMEAGGVGLVPVGTVNRCIADDFRAALDNGTKLIFLAHKSNYSFAGSYTEPSFYELSKLATEYDVPLVIDLGSGLLDKAYYPNLDLGLEFSVRQLLEEGVEIISFSGDKLLGGPQAGIIVGIQKWIDIIKKNQMLRALRAGKETYGLLTAVFEAYADGGDALLKIPAYRLLNRSHSECREMANTIADKWKKLKRGDFEIEVVDDVSLAGGGTLPELRIPTTVIKLKVEGRKPAEIASILRKLTPPIVARATGEDIVIDPRTLFDNDIDCVINAIKNF